MEKTMYLDTREEFSQEDYKEYCEDNGITYDENDEQAFYDWEYDMWHVNTEIFWENLKHCEHKYDKVIITGMLGLWDGKREIYPVVDTLYNAINKCLRNSDDCKIFADENGVLNVYAYHHDGVNCFEIHFLTEYGEEHFDEDEWNEMSDEEKQKCFDNGNFDYLF